MSQGAVEPALTPGTIVLGKYRVDCSLGAGGMGLVVAATHVELQDRVAIKLLLPEFANNPELVARFVREARAAASLRSEHVVRVFDVGHLDSGTPYMVMELLEGTDLATGPQGEHLPLEDAVDYVIQTCDAMSVAHAHGMVHRDLKPANLFLANDEHGVPIIKVLDFGISKLKQASPIDGTLTADRSVMGSPQYMSPEQVRSARDVDARADIWSLGTILYELIAGRPAFTGETVGSIFVAVASETPTSLGRLRTGVPPGLEAIVFRCLRKNPADRYQTAQELQDQLFPYGSERSRARLAIRRSGQPMPIVVVPPARSPSEGTGTAWTETGLDTSQAKPKPSAVRWAGLAALLVVLVGAAIMVSRAALREPGSGTAAPESASSGVTLGVALSAAESSPGTGYSSKAIARGSRAAAGIPTTLSDAAAADAGAVGAAASNVGLSSVPGSTASSLDADAGRVASPETGYHRLGAPGSRGSVRRPPGTQRTSPAAPAPTMAAPAPQEASSARPQNPLDIPFK